MRFLLSRTLRYLHSLALSAVKWIPSLMAIVRMSTSKPQFDVINNSINELATEVRNTVEVVQSQTSSLQNLHRTISSVSDGLSTKADNSELQALKAIVTQLQKDVLLQTPLFPSFTEDDPLALDMVAEFGTMAITTIHDIEIKEQARSQAEIVAAKSKATAEASAVVATTNDGAPTSADPDCDASHVDDDKEGELNSEEPSQSEGEQEDEEE
ncbi:hypothetical protein L6452_35972 [Arctium lappa]|uniref:Uncharacterized protein n=1 Tax=Arctium lappa TaxID=4217 RepID=A0ACB8Y9E6_ARCLA|nr:hypothetical protein L6452_35972 [Arctium lappa]